MLKVGDKVKIKINKVELSQYDTNEFSKLINNYNDEVYEISKINNHMDGFKYKINHNNTFSYFKEDELELFKIEKNNKLDIEKNNIIEIALINNDDYEIFLKEVSKKIKKYQDDNLKVKITYNTNVAINKLTFTAFIEARL